MGRTRRDAPAGRGQRPAPLADKRGHDQEGVSCAEDGNSRDEIRQRSNGRFDRPPCRGGPLRNRGPDRMSRIASPTPYAHTQNAVMFPSAGSENTHAPARARQASFSPFPTTASSRSSARPAFARRALRFAPETPLFPAAVGRVYARPGGDRERLPLEGVTRGKRRSIPLDRCRAGGGKSAPPCSLSRSLFSCTAVRGSKRDNRVGPLTSAPEGRTPEKRANSAQVRPVADGHRREAQATVLAG